MKSILLTTTALVAFAGAAVADGHTSVSFGGDAKLGYNDTINASDDNDFGFYWEADLNVKMSATLDNGLTAAAKFEFDIVDETNGQVALSDAYVLSLTSDTAGLYVGDTSFAAETRWVSAGDMESDGFSEQDGENVIRGDVAVAGIEASVSYTLTNAAGAFVQATNGDDTDQLSVGVTGDFGMVSFSAAYQEESEAVFGAAANAANGDYNASEVFGVSASGTFAGATVTVAYASDETLDENSTGIKVAYPFGPVTATAYYVSEDDADGDDNFGVKVAYSDGPISASIDYQDDQGTTKTAVDTKYDIGNGLAILAGYYAQDNESGAPYEDEFYVAGTYDLGGGAKLLVSYAEGVDNPDDEIGGPDYQEGTTVEVSFSF